MVTPLDPKQVISFEEFLMSQLTNKVVDKGGIFSNINNKSK